MPTGYTAAIKDGISFETFVWKCARARDDSMDAPIPEAFTPSPYHTEALEDARIELARLKAMTSHEISAACAAAYDRAVKSHGERIAEANELRRKYLVILAKVNQWTPPTPEHEGLKTFMADQLRSSIDWDCDTKYYTVPPKMEPAAWHAAAVERAEKDVAYHEQELAKEIERTNERNAWLKALRESVPPPLETPTLENNEP